VVEALSKLDALVVIDQVMTETAAAAQVVFADAPAYGKEGTFTNADRRVQRRLAAQTVPGDARPGWQTLSALGTRLAQRLDVDARFTYAEAADVTEEITRSVPRYERFHFYGYQGWGRGRAVDTDAAPAQARLQPVALPQPPGQRNGDVALLTGRTLYTSLEGAAVRSPEADKLHREEGVYINQYEASELGIAMGDRVVVKNGSAQVSLSAVLTVAIPRGAVFVPSYLDGGAVNALLPAENGAFLPPRVTLEKAPPT
jgi:formate dehydrogenase major subunit